LVLHQVAWPRIAPGRREPTVGLPPHTGELAGIVITRAPSTVRGHPRRRLLHRPHLNGATIYVLAVIEHARPDPDPGRHYTPHRRLDSTASPEPDDGPQRHQRAHAIPNPYRDTKIRRGVTRSLPPRPRPANELDHGQWIKCCRTELLNRALIYNRAHLLDPRRTTLEPDRRPHRAAQPGLSRRGVLPRPPPPGPAPAPGRRQDLHTAQETLIAPEQRSIQIGDDNGRGR